MGSVLPLERGAVADGRERKQSIQGDIGCVKGSNTCCLTQGRHHKSITESFPGGHCWG